MSQLVRSCPETLLSAYSPTAIKRLSRLVAAVPPLVLAISDGNLDYIFGLTGMVAFFFEFFIPCWFVYLARSRCANIWGVTVTPYSSPFQRPVWIVACLLVAILSLSLPIVANLLS